MQPQSTAFCARAAHLEIVRLHLAQPLQRPFDILARGDTRCATARFQAALDGRQDGDLSTRQKG